MNSDLIKRPCPGCNRELTIMVHYNSRGVIEPFLVRCKDPENEHVGCDGVYVMQGEAITKINTAFTPVPTLADALKTNGNGHTVPASEVTA
jgi:hypothetical protein